HGQADLRKFRCRRRNIPWTVVASHEPLVRSVGNTRRLDLHIHSGTGEEVEEFCGVLNTLPAWREPRAEYHVERRVGHRVPHQQDLSASADEGSRLFWVDGHWCCRRRRGGR